MSMQVHSFENANGSMTLSLVDEQGKEVSRQWVCREAFEAFLAVCTFSDPVTIYHEFAQMKWAREAA